MQRQNFRFWLCAFLLAVSTVAPYFWFFLPSAIALLRGPWVPLAFLGNVVATGLLHRSPWLTFDLLGLILFWCLGFLLRFRKDRDGLQLVVPVAGIFLVTGIVSFLSSVLILNQSYEAFSHSQLKAALLPYFFHIETLGAKELEWFASVLKNIYASGLLGWWATVGGLGIYLNSVIVRFVESLDEGKPVSGWESLQKWSCPVWVLGCLVGSLALTILAVEAKTVGIPEAFSRWLQPVAWTALVLSGFPLFLQGLGLVAFILPRLGFFLLFATLFLLLFLNPVLVLVLAGLLDLWFDLRSRFPESDEA